MAVGRISGPLLAQNLFRDNIPLAFYNTSSSDNPLLYLDVQTGLVGIGKPNPSYQLDVNGTVNAKAFRSIYTGAGTGQATIGRLFLSTGTISTTLGPVTIQPSGNENINLVASTRVYSTVGSIGTETGAFTVAGGVGIAENLYIGGITNIISGVPATTSTDGALVVTGGVGISQDLWVGGIIHGTITTSSVAISAESSKFIEINTASQGIYYPVLTGATKGSTAPYTNDEFKFYLENGILSTPLLTVTTPTQSVSNTSGAVIVSGGVGIGANLNVGGNVSASGTLTAQGNTQLGSNTSTNTLAVNAEITSDLIPHAGGTYNIGATTSSWAAGFFDNLYATILASQEGAININPASGLLEINAEIKVNGRKPIGTAPVVTNVLYVSTDGSDTNDGRAQDASRACRTIAGALRSPYYAPGTSIKVAPGIYRENNPLVLQPYTSIIGSDLRTTSIEPINKTQDLFHLQSGCYLAQMQFLNGRSGLLPGQYANGYNRGAYATAFPPQVGGTKIDVFHSPYVQNCTNQNGPWLNDGTLFIPNQTVQIPLAVGTGTWIANTTTIVVSVSTGTITTGMKINSGQQNPGFFNARTLLLANKPFIQEQVNAYIDQNLYGSFQYDAATCSRDIGLIIDSVGLDLVYGGTSQSVFTGLQYWAHTGYTGDIGNEVTTTTNAFAYISSLAVVLAQGIAVPSPYQLIEPQVTNLPGGAPADAIRISDLFDLIIDVISNGTIRVTDRIIPNGTSVTSNGLTLNASAILQANKDFLKEEAIAWITANTSVGFSYDQELCKRDVGYLIDCICFDLLRGGNRQSIQAGVCYFGWGSSTVIENEITQTVAAYDYMKTVIKTVVRSNPVVNPYQTSVPQIFDNVNSGNFESENTLGNVIDIITGIISAGPAGAPPLVPIGLTLTQNTGLLNAYTLLNANKAFIRAEVLAYVSTFPSFVYNKAKSFRDVGIIIENIIYDATFGGNEKSVESGKAFYDGVTSVIAGQETQCIAGINYINTLAQDIINNTPTTDLLAGEGKYQQVINTALVGGSIAGDSISTNIDIITDIIANGVEVAPTVYKSSGPDNSFVSAEILLQANRQFIQNDVMSWISNTYPTFQYNQDKCYRDVGLIVDAVSQDIVVGGNSKTVEAGLTYWKGGYNQIVGQETTTTQAIAHARDICLKIISNQTVTKQAGFTYDQAKCFRDVGLIVDALAFDLLYQGTSQSAFTGLQYWNQNGYTGEIPTEITQTIAAITYLKTLMTNVAGGNGNSTIEGTVADNFDEIIYILQHGTTAVTDAIVPNGFASTDPSVIAVYNAFKNNRVFFQDTIINFITSTYPSLQYNASTCRRDVGYIVDSIAFDVLHGGNRQSIMSGVYYYNFNGNSTAVPNEIPQVKAAYTHIKDIVGDIIRGNTITAYQSTVTQAFSYSVATENEVVIVENCAELIVDIIVNGPSQAPEHVPISLTASTSTYVANAFNLLLVNRDFIKAEVVAYVDTLYTNNIDQVINTFFAGGEAAELAVARNFDIINTIITQGPNLAPPIYQGGGLFSLTGINGDDIKLAPVVTNVASLGNKRYQVTLDTATIGFGINSTLYFGETAVFPAVDSTVPEQWGQRRVDARGGMGGSLVDGGVVSSRSPIASFVYDAFTQVAQGGRGIHIINNGYAQLVSVFTIFCSTAVEVDSGGIGSITNSNSNFGDTCLVAKGYGKREFSGTVYNPAFPDYITNGEYYPTGYFPQRGETLIFVPDTANRPHIALIMEVEPPKGYTNAYGYPGFVTAAPNISTLTTGTITIEGIDTTDIAIGQSIYVRDQYGRSYDSSGKSYLAEGTIVSDIGYQSITLNKGLTSGGGDPTNANYFTLYTCGNAYYTVLSSSIYKNPVPVGISQIPNQNGCATLLDFINTLTQLVISNTTATITYSTLTQTILPTVLGGAGSTSFVNDHINIIKDIAVNGTEVAPTIVKTGTSPSGAGSAIALIKANSEFIAQETIAYVGSVDYDETICSRDTGLIVDAISQDLLFDGTSQSKFAGIQYWYQTGLVGDIPNELTTTTNAIGFVRDLATKLITGSIISQQYQLNTFPAEGYNTSTQTTAQLAIDDFNLIIDIITNGTANVTDRIIPNGITATASIDIQNAFDLLQVNKEFIKEETIAYIEATKTPGFIYNATTCARDIGFMIDSVSVDILYGGNRQAIQSGTYYYGYNPSSETIRPEEIPQVNAAYTHIKTIIPYIVKGIPVPTAYQNVVTQDTSIDTGTDAEANIMKSCIDLIENIITNGPSVVTSKVAIDPVALTDPAVVAAATAMQNNRDFIRAEVIAYINTIFLTGNNRVKCIRDTRLILQQLIYDLENGGNYYSVYSGLSLWSRSGTYHLVQLGENISNPGLMPDGSTVNFYQRSYISASGYLFEYVGAGTNYSSLPQVGRADPVQSKEVLQLDGGKVFFTSTDQNGDFRIGPGLVISQATGVLSGRTFTKSLFAEMTPFILAVEGAG